MTDSSEFTFSSAIRGFYVYRHEDHFAVAVIQVGEDGSQNVVGHIPRELSRLLSHKTPLLYTDIIHGLNLPITQYTASATPTE